MVNERKEPTFSTGSKDGSGKDSVQSLVKESPATEVERGSNLNLSANPSSRSLNDDRSQVVVRKQSSFLLWMALLIAVVASVASGYLYLQFTTTQQIISEQQGRLAELENKLLLSDDESTQSLTALTANVKGLDEDVKGLDENVKGLDENVKGLDKNVSLAMSEVDKLWATRKANLKQLTETKKELNKRIDTSDDQSKKIVDDVSSQLKKSLASVKQSSTEQELLLQSLRERVSEQKQTISVIQSTLKSNAKSSESLKAMTENLNQLEQKITIFTRRTKEYDEAIESFDKFRITTNRDLITLKNR